MLGREKVAEASPAAAKPFCLMPWGSLMTGKGPHRGSADCHIGCVDYLSGVGDDCGRSGQAAVAVGVTHALSFNRL